MLASVPGSQKHPSSREMYGRLRGSGSLRGAFLGSDVIFAQQGVSVSFQSRYGAIISMVILTKLAHPGRVEYCTQWSPRITVRLDPANDECNVAEGGARGCFRIDLTISGF